MDYSVLAVDIKRTRPIILKLKAKLREERAIEEAKKIRILYRLQSV